MSSDQTLGTTDPTNIEHVRNRAWQLAARAKDEPSTILSYGDARYVQALGWIDGGQEWCSVNDTLRAESGMP